MESLEIKLNNVTTLTDLNSLISENKIRTGYSFMGERVVQVGDYEGSVPLISLWGKYIIPTERNSEPLSLNDRVIGLDVSKKLREIESQKSSIEAPKGLFGMIYKIGVYLRQFIIGDGATYDSNYTPSDNDNLLGFTSEAYKELTRSAPFTLTHDDKLDRKSDVIIKNKTFFVTEETLRELAQKS